MKARLVVMLFIIAAAALIGFRYSQQHAPARVEPVASLSSKTNLTPRLPAPRMRVTAPITGYQPEELQPTNIVALLRAGKELPKLKLSQLQTYLDANHRSAASLLAAFRATGDASLLQEARERFPNDPRVAFVAIYQNGSPEERRQWIDNLKQSAPDNALGHYVSAFDHFKSGQTDQAVQDLVAASGKSKWQDYSMDSIQNAEEAYRAAGYSEVEAKAVAVMEQPLPQLSELKGLSQNLIELANSYRQAGDEASAQAALQMGLNLGQRLEDPSQVFLINNFVGLAIERQILRSMDPASPYDNAGHTVKDQLDELARQRDAIRDLNKVTSGFLEKMSDQDLISYLDREKMFGSQNAMQWVLSRYPQK
jgi:tetratricopeptide (TPR) repeat protein